MYPVTESPFETVTVKQCHEKLKIRFLAVVRRCRHQQEVPREGGKKLTEMIALRIFRFGAENRGRHLVRLIADHEIPSTIRHLKLLLHVFVSGKLVQPGNDQIALQEPVAGASGLKLVIGKNFEGQMETAVKLVLPLLGKAARTDDKTSLQIASGDQFFDQKTRHDGLARSRIICKKKSQRLPWQHGLVNRCDLVRQRVNQRGVDGQNRIEKVRQADAVRFGNQAEQSAISVKTPGPALFHKIKALFVISIEQLVRHLAGRCFVGKLKRLCAKPLHTDDRDQRVRKEPADRSVWLKVFESNHLVP